MGRQELLNVVLYLIKSFPAVHSCHAKQKVLLRALVPPRTKNNAPLSLPGKASAQQIQAPDFWKNFKITYILNISAMSSIDLAMEYV